VFQFFNLIPVFSARENVELPLLLTHLKKAERRERAETALRIVGSPNARATCRPRCLAASSSAWRSRARS